MNATDILQSASLIIAALTVIFGVNAWRREYVGKRRIESAEEVLALFYEARDAVRHIRSPFGFGGEGNTRKQGERETPEEKQIYDKAYVVFERYNTHKELFSRIQAIRYRFMAQFGKDSAQPFDDLNKIMNEIFAASNMLVHYWLDQGRRQWANDGELKAHVAKMHEYEAVFWEMSADKDKITPRLNALISNLESQCNNIINRKTTYHRIWDKIVAKAEVTPEKKENKSTSKEGRVKKKWQSNLWNQSLTILCELFFVFVLVGMILYLVAQYQKDVFQPFELATVVGLIGGFPLMASFMDKTEGKLKNKLRIIGALYLLAAIFFVVFGFYEAADKAGLLKSAGALAWVLNAVYVVTLYLGAITFILGMLMTLLAIPELIGTNNIKDFVSKLFQKEK